MRQTFDSTMPVHEQLLRSSAMRKVGRKHRKTLGPGNHKPSVHAKNSAARKDELARAFKTKVAAYWKGELATYPTKKERP